MSTNEAGPAGAKQAAAGVFAKRLDTLDGKVIAELWNGMFKADKMFEIWRRELTALYPTVKFVPWSEFGEIHDAHEAEVLATLPAKFKEHGIDGAIIAVGCCGKCTGTVARTSAVVEKMGYPTVTALCSGFAIQGKMTAKSLGMPNPRQAIHQGQVSIADDGQLEKAVTGPMLQQIIAGLTA